LRANDRQAGVWPVPVSPILEEIDLSKTTKKGGAGLEVGPTYLVLYHGSFHTGRFCEVWHGLNFHGIFPAGTQYDPPGTNYSSWQRIWRIVDADDISQEAEPEYKRSRRDYALGRLKSNGQMIDESTPLDAYGYRPTVPAMPKRDADEERRGLESVTCTTEA
jgi:hypothetical protein